MLKKRDGTILLLAFLILSGILVTVGLIASVVFEQTKISRNIDNSILAFYAAESGVERGLYLLTPDGGGTFDDVKNTESLSNNASYNTNNSETKESEDRVYVGVRKNKTFQLDIYDADDSLAASNIQSLYLKTETAAGWAEVSWISWNPTSGSWKDFSTLPPKTRLLSPSILNSGTYLNLSSGTAYAYRVRIKALYNDLEGLEIKAYAGADGSGGQVSIPGRVVIKSIGEYGNSSQALKVSLPREAPIYGLYDYVIFSQESILK